MLLLRQYDQGDAVWLRVAVDDLMIWRFGDLMMMMMMMMGRTQAASGGTVGFTYTAFQPRSRVILIGNKDGSHSRLNKAHSSSPAPCFGD